eukprot:TRINITY_DN12053_c0_g1_i3.p1 TRINITY_DN12053_c0_g1~~TRINITY_DN12053_c0_g1_i3.p1  ORF type:complete len:341 (+),score=69.59 TRINITY_DN12053_c0_g1_i3:121-1023(+)
MLAEALTAANLDDAWKGIRNFTVFAPTDTAFTALLTQSKVTKTQFLARADLADILKFHAISGRKVMSSDLGATQNVTTFHGASLTVTKIDSVVKADVATVTIADVVVNANVVIHVIDKVLVPPDLMQVAVSNGNLGVLAEALAAANLVDALKGAGPFTVFAPTDTAFNYFLKSIGSTKAQFLARTDLADILNYHVIRGRKIMSSDFDPAQAFITLHGAALTVTKIHFVVKAGDAIVTSIDVGSSNAVIHVIDKVLLPPGAAFRGTVVGAAASATVVDGTQRAYLSGILLVMGSSKLCMHF